MKVEQFTGNTRDQKFSYYRTREGPNYFISYYKHSSTMHVDPLECWRVLGVSRFVDSGKALKAWCLEMVETYPIYGSLKTDDDEVVVENNKDKFFDVPDVEPNDNDTKMVMI